MSIDNRRKQRISPKCKLLRCKNAIRRRSYSTDGGMRLDQTTSPAEGDLRHTGFILLSQA